MLAAGIICCWLFFVVFDCMRVGNPGSPLTGIGNFYVEVLF